jgi:hypothetical protein
VSEAAALSNIEASVPKIKQPVKPQRAASSDHVFNLDLKDLFPKGKSSNDAGEADLRQLYQQYEKMLWQLSPNSDMKPEQLQREFGTVTGLSIKKLNERDYELTLEKPGQSTKVTVNPVLAGANYDKALASFNAEFAIFQQQMADREARLAARKAALTKEMEAKRKAARLDFDDRIAELRKQGYEYAANEEIIKKKVVNRFSASEFGIWNCDRPLPPFIMQMAVNFRDADGKAFANRTAYLVDKNRNTVYQFLAEDGATLRFNQTSENLLWLVTEDNKLAVFRPDDFKAIPPGKEQHDFVLKTIDRAIKTEQDVRDILLL